MTHAHEAVYLRFRGNMRRLPLVSFAAALRRDLGGAATALEILILGPPENRATEGPGSSPEREGGKGGGTRSIARSAVGPESIGTMGPEEDPHRFDPDRSNGTAPSESDRDLARRIAVAIEDAENVAAIERLVTTYPRGTINLALDRTLAVPAERIRVTRGALFTSLVRKLAEHAGSPSST